MGGATTLTGIRAFLIAVSHSLAQSEPIPVEVCLEAAEAMEAEAEVLASWPTK